MTTTKRYEVSPCREVSTETDDDVERCTPEQVEFWTVYRRMTDGRALAICDCLTQFDADHAALELNGLLEPLVAIHDLPVDDNGERVIQPGVLATAREAMMTGA